MPHRFGNLTLYHQPSSNPHHRPYTKGQAKKAGDQNPCLKGAVTVKGAGQTVARNRYAEFPDICYLLIHAIFGHKTPACERLSIYYLCTISFRMNSEYLKQVNAKIKEMDAEIVKLQQQAKEKSAQAQEEFNRRMEAIKGQRKDLQEKVDNLTKTGKEAAKDVTAGVDRAVEELKNALKQARSRFQ
jgi:hypothetical protein